MLLDVPGMLWRGVTWVLTRSASPTGQLRCLDTTQNLTYIFIAQLLKLILLSDHTSLVNTRTVMSKYYADELIFLFNL